MLDFTGLAQKNGTVVSQVRLASAANKLHAARIGPGETDLLLGTDLVVAAALDSLSKLNPNRSRALINREVVPTTAFVTDRDAKLPNIETARAIEAVTGNNALFIDATRLAEKLFSNSVAANTLMLGYPTLAGPLLVD